MLQCAQLSFHVFSFVSTCITRKLNHIIDTYTTGLETETYAAGVLIAMEVTENYRNDTIGTRMGSPSGTSSFVLVAIKVTMEKSSFRTGSEVAAHACEAAETPRVRYEHETNKPCHTEFSYLFPKELEGALPTNVTFVFY